jgi:hypothetical protein
MNRELEIMYANIEDTDPQFKRARWVTLEEANVLWSVCKEEAPDHIYESGTANGYSAAWLSLEGASVTTYDPVDRPKIWPELSTPPNNIKYVQETFTQVAQDAADTVGKKLFFIDGRHQNSGIREDLTAVMEVIKPGDVILLHDLNYTGVTRYFHRMQNLSASWKQYDTRRGVGKVVWGQYKGDVNGKKTSL